MHYILITKNTPMNKLLPLCMLLCLALPTLYAQSEYNDPSELTWITEFGGNANSYVISSVNDQERNLYTLAYSGSEMTFLGEEIGLGMFLCKQDHNGELIWLHHFDNVYLNKPYAGNNITLDQDEDKVIIASEFFNDIDLPDGSEMSPAVGGSVFFISFDSEGNYLDAFSEDIDISDDQISIEIDSEDNLIFSTIFWNEILVEDSTLEPNNGNGLLIKYDANGNIIWYHAITGTWTNYQTYVVVDEFDNIYTVSEENSDTVNIGGQEYLVPDGEGNVFLCKYNSDGEVQWTKTLAGANGETFDFFAWPVDIAYDGNGFIYINGWHGEAAYFDDIDQGSEYAFSKFVCKTDLEGEVQWVNSVNEISLGFNHFHSIVDSLGNYYAGYERVTDTLHFGDDFTYIAENEFANLLFKYASDGTLDWVKEIKCNSSSVDWNSIVGFVDDEFFLSGSYTDSIFIDEGEYYSEFETGFMALFGDETVGVEEIYSRDNSFSVFPNPSRSIINIDSEDQNIQELRVLDLKGQLHFQSAFQSQINLGHLPKGQYILEAIGEKGIYRKKVVLQ